MSSKIRFGCQTYAWQMSGEKYLGKLTHIMDVASRAGFKGVEPETQFLGALWEPEKMADALKEHGIQLAAVCLVEDWLNSKETDAERANADKTIAFLKHFPDTLLSTCQMPGADRNNLEERQANLLKCVNEVSARATDAGLNCAYHPNSPMGSVYRTAEDYEILLNGLDEKVTGWVPDVGHIAKGGMDALEKMKEFRPLIRHVHYKDMYDDGRWAQMGAGGIDYDAITSFLAESGFEGWIVVEDECDRAEQDPDATVLDDGVYVREKLGVHI